MATHKEIMAFVTDHIDTVLALAEDQMFGLENPGICIKCGSDQGGCEPDAREYKCENCGSRSVYGAQELVLYA